jgi:hypothetical protein
MQVGYISMINTLDFYVKCVCQDFCNHCEYKSSCNGNCDNINQIRYVLKRNSLTKSLIETVDRYEGDIL